MNGRRLAGRRVTGRRKDSVADPAAPPVENHLFHIVGKAKDLQTDVLNVKLTVKAKK